MPEITSCPKCQRQLRVPDDLLGRSVKCPSCGETFTAQAGSAPPAPPSSLGRSPSGESSSASYQPGSQEDFEFGGMRTMAPHRGTTILVLGILSLVVCGPILGPIAWIMGNNDLAQIRARRMDPTGEGLTQAGRICGMIATILSAAVLTLYCCLIIAAVVGSAGGGVR